jgi:hypothetical protein
VKKEEGRGKKEEGRGRLKGRIDCSGIKIK